MAKIHQRLDYTRLSEALAERGLVDPAALDDALQQCLTSGSLLAQVLVEESLASDWEVARVVCEVFNLPFLTVDICPPSEAAREGLNPAFLRHHLLVPLDRFGDVLTVAMPGLVPTEVLTELGSLAKAHVLPVVSTVGANRRWLDEFLPGEKTDEVRAALPLKPTAMNEDDDWASLFDEADAAVQLDLTDSDLDGAELEE